MTATKSTAVKRAPRTDIRRDGKRVMILYISAGARNRGEAAGWYWTTGEGMSQVFSELIDAERDAEASK